MIKFKPLEKTSPLQELNTLTWGIAFVLIGFSNIFNILWQYVVDSPFQILVFDQFGAFFFHIAVLLKIFNTELIINRHNYFYRGYYFSALLVGLTIFTFIVSPSTIRGSLLLNVIYLTWGTLGVSIYMYTFIFLYLRSEEYRDRKIALKILICPVLFVVGMVFQPQNMILHISAIPLLNFFLIQLIIIPQTLISIGIILMYTTYNDNFQKRL
ncbi:MAG: hypothetical protein R6U96_11280 [Promethearchaeia archaeon]